MYARDIAVIATPIGPVRIAGDDRLVHRIEVLTTPEPVRRADGPAVVAAAEQIEAYFDGALRDFDLALAPPSTRRGIALRDGLIGVGYGETVTYGGLARRLDSAARAIGQLCAQNPFPIVVPCHRVLSSPGTAENYSAGDGVRTKAWLLDHERRHSGGSLL